MANEDSIPAALSLEVDLPKPDRDGLRTLEIPLEPAPPDAAIVTVLALPINLVAGLFGMNVGGIPLSTHPYGFFVVVGVVGLLTGLLAWTALGRRRDR